MGLLPEKYDKYIRFFKFMLKYWNSDMFSESEQNLHDVNAEKKTKDFEFDHDPEEFAQDLQKMGPTYIKLGQLLSTRPDLLPNPFLKALTNLQDDVEGIPYSEIEQIFKEEIGQSISKAFLSFDRKPTASASIGQVHQAVLHSGGKVAVKIQKPGVQKRFVEDLETLKTLAEKVEQYNEASRKFSIYELVEELEYMLLQELDYTKEADNLRVLKKNLKEFKHLYIPEVVPSYCSRKVLTMSFIEGQKVTKLSPYQLMDLPKEALVDEFIKGYLKQIIVDGFAHADPHPGNIHVTKNGKLALMDLGMVARFSNKMREKILKLILGLGTNNGDQVTEVLLEMSEFDRENANLDRFRKKVIRKTQENQNSEAQDLQTGRSILEINKIAIHENIQLPSELSTLGKILLNMDQIIAFLSPEHQIQQTVRKYMEELLRQRMFNQMKSGQLLQTLLESKELAEKLPYRLNKIMGNLAENKFRIKMDTVDEHRFILAFQKVANRITTGLIIAALILGAALLMRIPTTWTILGYPGFAILLFILAASIGLYLVYQILFKDEDESE